jgi:hypothetical protein
MGRRPTVGSGKLGIVDVPQCPYLTLVVLI